MSEKNNSSFQSHNYFHRLSKALEFAASEWLLMFLLFIDACFTYVIAKFASYCQLQGPCVLCSRYDHVLAKDKAGIYWNSICKHHKSEISSLILSHVHGICQNCLLSFTNKTKNKFNDEKIRLLVGKIGSSSPLLENGICFCCNEEFDSKHYAKNLLLNSSMHSDASESLLANGEHIKNEKNIFVDESLETFTTSHVGKNQFVALSDVEYQKVNVNSDSESEHLVSDDRSARDLVPEVYLKSDSETEPVDPHHKRDTEELKWQDGANNEITSRNTEQILFDEVPSSNIVKTPVDAFLETIDSPITEEPIKDPVTSTEQSTTTNGHQTLNQLELNDAYKLAISTKGRQLSGKLLDQKSFKESSTRVNEDLKILLSHRSNDNNPIISPKLSFNSDELSSIQFLQRRISLERNESNISLDGSVVSEIEGETIVDRLKRQVEHDKRLMSVLYKELEEERNASAVATNQAMAMITRLQEEKSALYTEALQCLRMMEEQAEYDNEALQKANEIIEEKDRLIRELERNGLEDVRE